MLDQETGLRFIKRMLDFSDKMCYNNDMDNKEKEEKMSNERMREIEMYGMSKEVIREEYLESITAQLSRPHMEMVVMGILSDCQEMIAMKNPTIPAPSTDEYIRKQLNVAKYVLSEMMKARETA
jgi:hypothetical protein